MAYKETKLTPVLYERTCDNEDCDGLIRFKKVHEEKGWLRSKYWYEYECEKCGKTIKSDFPIKTQNVVFINEETGKRYTLARHGYYL